VTDFTLVGPDAGNARVTVRRYLVIGAAALSFALAPQASAGTFGGHNGRIAYVQTVAGQTQVFTMAANGRDRRQVTNQPGGANSPDWTRDGGKLAFSVGGTTIDTSDALGGGLSGIAGDINALDPSWAPDGGNLAVTGVQYRPDGQIETSSIYVLHADGSGQQRIVDGSDPVWSPDGNWILYRPTDATSDFCPGILAVRPDGSDLHYVVSNYRDENGACTGGGSDPSVSPDSKRVVYVAPNGRDLYKVSIHGGTARRLKSDKDQKREPLFSPDGQRILYVTATATRTIPAKKGGRVQSLGAPVSQPSWQAT
jgi:Tol biopolymer transport system component